MTTQPDCASTFCMSPAETLPALYLCGCLIKRSYLDQINNYSFTTIHCKNYVVSTVMFANELS